MKTIKRRDFFAILLLVSLTLWYGLSFLGVPGLVGSWRITDGLWFYLAAALAVGLVVGIYALLRSEDWGDWLLMFLLGGWIYIQYLSHWRRFFIPPSLERVQQYYSSFPYWYLIPKLSTRVVPDGYHAILHVLILTLFIVVLVRVIRQLRYPATTRKKQSLR